MAREINAELLDTKIEKAQQDLAKAKHLYDAVAATLKDLLDKRDSLRQKKLLDAIAQSGRSYSFLFPLYNVHFSKLLVLILKSFRHRQSQVSFPLSAPLCFY